MFPDLLRTCTSALADVSDLDTLATFHARFAQSWAPRGSSLAGSCNATYGLTADTLVQPEVGYLCVEQNDEGRTQPVTLVSANPGYSEQLNRVERRVKEQRAPDGSIDLAAYERYRRNYFTRFWSEVAHPTNWRRAMWWNNALNFLHDVADLPSPRRMMGLHAELNPLGWELFPFHSRRDGLTPLLQSAPELRAFALASLQAACRVSRGVVVVASKHGCALLRSSDAFGDEKAVVLPGGLEAVSVVHVGTGRRVVGIARQLFAAWRPSAETLQAAAAFAAGREVPKSGPGRPSDRRPTDYPLSAAVVSLVLYDAAAPTDQPMVLVYDVPGSPALGIEQLREDSQDEEVHARIAGYWPSGDYPSSRVDLVGQALRAGRRVLLIGKRNTRHGHRVLRALEVHAGSEFELPLQVSGERTLTQLSEQPEIATFGDTPTAFATFYRADAGGRLKVRYHTVSVDDGQWRGARLEPPERWPQNKPPYMLPAGAVAPRQLASE